LSEEALTGEASKAAAGDVHGRVVGGHAKEFVQFTDSERLVHQGLLQTVPAPLGRQVEQGGAGGVQTGARWLQGGF
jgi:hypothetical protein